VRLRTPQGEPCQGKDDKAVASELGIVATYQDHTTLIAWVNEQPLARPLTCLGDGHDGVWNIVKEMTSFPERREILDWYHLVENLHKVGGSIKRLEQGETLLWQGNVEAAMAQAGAGGASRYLNP